jgi:hypothetical protein
MKKSIVGLFILILALNFVSALDIEGLKSSYSPGETMQIEIPDAFIGNLNIDNLGIYQTGNVHPSPAESNVFKSGNSYFYYAVLPTYATEYYLKIDGIKHWEGSVESENPITENFTIKSSNSSYLSFSPGYIFTAKDFSVTIKAYNQRQDITVEFAPSNFKKTFNMGYQDTKTVYIPISGIYGLTEADVKINSYAIPAVIYAPNQTTSDDDNETIEDSEDDLGINESLEDIMDFYPETLTATVLSNVEYYFPLRLTNYATGSIKDLEISTSDPEVKVNPSSVSELNRDDSIVINVTIKSLEEKDAWINITYKNYSAFIPVLIKIAQNQSAVDSNIDSINEQKTCTSFGGVECNYAAGETCTGSETFTSNGLCCLDKCQVPSSGSTWIWGILALLALGGAGWYFYNKSKEGQGEDKTGSILKKRTANYEERLNPTEVRKGLAKT